MVYFLDRNFSKDELLVRALCRVYGVGRSTAYNLCGKCGLSKQARVGDLDMGQTRLIMKEVKTNLITDTELLVKVKGQLLLKRKLATNQGIRYKKGLPVRGQRTHTNAMSARNIRTDLE